MTHKKSTNRNPYLKISINTLAFVLHIEAIFCILYRYFLIFFSCLRITFPLRVFWHASTQRRRVGRFLSESYGRVSQGVRIAGLIRRFTSIPQDQYTNVAIVKANLGLQQVQYLKGVRFR